MNMKRSEFVLGALSVAFVGCTKNLTHSDESAIRAWVRELRAEN